MQKIVRIIGKFCKTKFLLNKVANAKQTCPRFLLPLGFCIRFFQVLHCNVSDCCSKQQTLESWILCKNWYERLFVVNFLNMSFEKKCMLILNNRLITLTIIGVLIPTVNTTLLGKRDPTIRDTSSTQFNVFIYQNI